MSNPVDAILRGRVLNSDCMDAMLFMEDSSIDSCVCDPPYHLQSIVKRFGSKNAAPVKEKETGVYARASRGFMGKTWDGGDIAFRAETWAEVYRVLKPGAFLLAFSGTRTYHRMAVAIEDAGFEIREMLAWTYGTGFPKSHNVAKAIEAQMLTGKGNPEGMRRLAMADAYEPSGRGRVNYDNGGGSQMNGEPDVELTTPEALAWQGWGTALKPALEPVCVARKPLVGTVAENVLEWGTGALNIDGCRVAGGPPVDTAVANRDAKGKSAGWKRPWMQDQDEVTRRQVAAIERANEMGRWPANLIHDGSAEVLELFPDSKSSGGQASLGAFRAGKIYGVGQDVRVRADPGFGDEGSAARFFYHAKASKKDRRNSKHPTVKPISLLRYLVRLVTPPGGTVLDPFAGSGTLAEAAALEGFDFVLIEREPEYYADIKNRIFEFVGERL